jgi:hypothetical protein
MSKSPRARPVGRPAVEISPVQVRDCARFALDVPQIAAILNCSERTLRRRLDRKEYREAYETGRELAKHDIKRMLFATAQNGSVKTMTFLACNVCGWSDKISGTVEQNVNFVVEIPAPLDADQWHELYGSGRPAIDVTPAKIAEKP